MGPGWLGVGLVSGLVASIPVRGDVMVDEGSVDVAAGHVPGGYSHLENIDLANRYQRSIDLTRIASVIAT